MPSETKQQTVVRSEKGRWGRTCSLRRRVALRRRQPLLGCGRQMAAEHRRWVLRATWTRQRRHSDHRRLGRRRVEASRCTAPTPRPPKPASPAPRRLLACMVAAGTLIIYGAVLTIIGLLVQADVVHSPANTDWRALPWHAYLWDPWFLVWVALIATALLRSRTATPRRATRARDTCNQCESAPQAQQPGGGDANANTGTTTKPHRCRRV